MICTINNTENGKVEVMFVAWISHVRPHNTRPECHDLHYSSWKFSDQ
jgi:hypothetical protein